MSSEFFIPVAAPYGRSPDRLTLNPPRQPLGALHVEQSLRVLHLSYAADNYTACGMTMDPYLDEVGGLEGPGVWYVHRNHIVS